MPGRGTFNGRVAPSLVEETACAVEVVEVGAVGVASPKVETADLKVGPEVTSVVRLATVA